MRAIRSDSFTRSSPPPRTEKPTREHAAFTGLPSVMLSPGLLKDQDAVIVVTDHDGVDYAAVAAHARLVIDTRNALSGVERRDNIVKA